MKIFYIQHNIGKAKYVVNYHDGIQKHTDGSDFLGVAIFKNKKKLQRFVNELLNRGYAERTL